MEEEVLGKAYDGRLMRRLLRYMAPYSGRIAAALGFLFLYSLLQVSGPLLTKLAVDKYLAPSGQGSPLDPWLSAEPVTGLTQIAMLYLAVLAGIFVTEFAQMYLMQYVGQLAMFDLRRELMAHMQKLDLAFFDRNPVGRLVTRLTTDVDVLNDLFASGLVTILGDLLTLSFIVAAMLRMSLGLTFIMLAVLPLVIWATARFRASVSSSYRRIRLAIARINAYLQEHIVGMTVLQLFNRENKSIAEFEEINGQHMEAYKDSIGAYGWFYPVVEFLAYLSLAFILSYGGYRVKSWSAITGRCGGFSAVWASVFPTHSGFKREVQHSSSCHGLGGTNFPSIGHAGYHPGACCRGACSVRLHHRIRPCLVCL